MQTHLSEEFKASAAGQEAETILRQCVHCGLCNASCPTYQLLGDELDGPRGRIYLIKQMLEGGAVTRSTQQHLDRCLTCLGCEPACPSGVRYGQLLEIGRPLVDARVARPPLERALRWVLRTGLTARAFAPAVRLARWTRPLLPASLRRKLPDPPGASCRPAPSREHRRKVLLFTGCVQPALLPNIQAATVRVLDAASIQSVQSAQAGCCGALRAHLSDPAGALNEKRRNIDAWWPAVESAAVEAIVVNASACAHEIKQYAHALRHDPAYAAKAARVSALTRDLSELLPDLRQALEGPLCPRGAKRLAFHAPCTLQHGQRLRDDIEAQLAALGFEVEAAREERHWCCGSAGVYSELQPQLSLQLRDRKLAQLTALGADCIVSANVGCILHLQRGTTIPVKHWIEVLADALPEG